MRIDNTSPNMKSLKAIVDFCFQRVSTILRINSNGYGHNSAVNNIGSKKYPQLSEFIYGIIS